MSFNQHTGYQNSSSEAPSSQPQGGRVSNDGQPVSNASNVNSNQYAPFGSRWRRIFTNIESSTMNQGLIPVAHGSAHWDSSMQNSNTHAPTTRQPPTLPSIAATSGILSYQGPSTSYSWNNQNTSVPHSWTQVHIGGETWISSNPVKPLNWLHLPSTPVDDNPNSPWNENSSPAPLNPHRVVASTSSHLAAAGYHPSTFKYGRVSARNQELIDGSAPLGPSNIQSRGPNPLGAVGESGPAYTRYVVSKFGRFTARRQARMSNAQSQEVEPGMNEVSDSVGMDTPSSDDEAELYDCSVNGDRPRVEDEDEEQDEGVDEELVESRGGLTNGLNAEG